MTPIEFLTAVWPSEGLYCIATPVGKSYEHRVFETIAAAASCVESLKNTKNIFFATHTLKEERVWNSTKKDFKTGEPTGAWSYRTQKNMRASRVFFFDLDVSPKYYTTQSDAIEDLKRFTNVTGLPRPMLVSSGSGIHVYWVLEESVSSADVWITQAARLKQLAVHHRLKIDPTRTTDTSSVLRVAGSNNLKDPTNPRPVKVLATTLPVSLKAWDRMLLKAIDDADLTAAKAREPVPDDGGLGSNTERDFSNLTAPSAVAVLKACGQMRRLAQTKGNCSEPEWFWGCVGVMKFTENGEANAHKISSGYPKYTHAETQAKIEHWGKNPTTCLKLEEVSGVHNEDICKKCKFYPQNQSPIRVARLVDTAPPPVVLTKIDMDLTEAVQIPSPPAPYARQNDGSVGLVMGDTDKGGKQWINIIYPYDLYPIGRTSNANKETEQHTWRVHLPHLVEPRDFTLEASTFVDEKGMATRLANLGVYPNKIGDLRGYMSAYIQQLQKENPVTEQHNQLGWTDNHTKFVLPTKTLLPGGKVSHTSLSKMASSTKDFVFKKGTLEKQVELLHFYDDPNYVASQFMVLSSLGAAIFWMTGHHGVIVHATGEPGSSKSTALYAAASLWGAPMQYVMNGTGDGATPLARGARREVLANLPLCLDEITHIAGDVAKNFVMNATQVSGRIRLERDGTPMAQTTTSERSSMTLTTANSSLHALLQIDNTAGTASSVRVFEIMFKKLYKHETYEADEFLLGLRENFGHIGEQFARIIVDNQEKVVRKVRETMKTFGIRAGAKPEERFWFGAAASNMVAREIVQRAGYISWQAPLLEAWLIDDQLPHLRGTVAEEAHSASGLNTLTTYIEHINGDMVKTNRPHGGNLSQPIQAPHGELVAHYEIDTKTMWVLKDHFKRWCQRRGQYGMGILKELHKQGVVPVTSMQFVLGEGTSNHAKGKSNCFIVDMGHKDIAAVQPVLAVIRGGKAGTP